MLFQVDKSDSEDLVDLTKDDSHQKNVSTSCPDMTEFRQCNKQDCNEQAEKSTTEQ